MTIRSLRNLQSNALPTELQPVLPDKLQNVLLGALPPSKRLNAIIPVMGLEPTISASGGRRLIHWATGAIVLLPREEHQRGATK